MLGAIFGDIVGSIYEFHNIKTKRFPLLQERSHFTDDTVMTVAVAWALIKLDQAAGREELPKEAEEANGEAAWKTRVKLFRTFLIESMHHIGAMYPHAGYGGQFRVWLYGRDTEPYWSFGNGSAMRVSPVAWYASSLEETVDFAKVSAAVTHNHPEGIKGAVVAAGATYLARTGATKEEIRAFVAKYYQINFTLDEIRPTYRFNETCQGTVPQAMQAFFESTSFEDAIRNAVSLGGDSDTLAAITGAVAEAYYGMSATETQAAAARLDPILLEILWRFKSRFVQA